MKSKSEYGEFLTQLIKEKNMSQSSFYSQLGIKKPYFYDIIAGRVNPPPYDIQLKIIQILNLKENDIYTLLDLAANKRNEIPYDIAMYLKNSHLIKKIRQSDEYKKKLGGIFKCQKN
mgnify:CR=1 FL=1